MPLFAELSEQDLHRLADLIAEEPYKQGEYIVRQGYPGTTLYIIARGQASFFRIVLGLLYYALLITLSKQTVSGPIRTLRRCEALQAVPLAQVHVDQKCAQPLAPL